MSAKTLVQTSYNANSKDFLLTLFLDDKNNPAYIFLEDANNPSIVGNVYLARVEKVLTNIDAAFLQLENGQKAFLQYGKACDFNYVKRNSLKNVLSQGDEILVEITKDAHKSKEAVCTSNVLMDGNNIILSSLDKKIGVSKKIPQDKRNEIKAAFEEKNLCYGFIVRSSAIDVDINELINEADFLVKEFEKYLQIAKNSIAPKIIYKRDSLIKKLIKVNAPYLDKVIFSNEEFKNNFLKEFNGLELQETKLEIYEDSFPLKALYSIDTIIDNYTKKVKYLKNGGNIIIEQMETLTAIDVNSSHNNKKKQNSFELNKEACELIAEEIRLRNIYGMILIDFLKMNSRELESELISYMRELMSNDYSICNVVDFTRLGLMEITREKTYPSLKELLT